MNVRYRVEQSQAERDQITVGVALLMPLVMLFLFGYAISLDVDDVAIGLLDQDRSAASRDLTDRFVQSGYFRLAEVCIARQEVDEGI